MTIFGLKKGQDLENREAHPPQEFRGVTPPVTKYLRTHFDMHLKHVICLFVAGVASARNILEEDVRKNAPRGKAAKKSKILVTNRRNRHCFSWIF